jgi:N-carbamoyl-D-amino-acid hydrolase
MANSKLVPRILSVGAAQMGPIARAETRKSCVERMLVMLGEASRKGCQLVVFPELALTTFFPRWYMTDWREVDAFFETEMPNADVAPLFAEAKRLKIGFYLGYAEKTPDGHRFNSSILVDTMGVLVGKYRKIHLPGHAENEPARPFQHLEKRYFEPGDIGFPVWRTMGGILGMAICNDRRWPETYRVMGLKGMEMLVLGYNTPAINGSALVHSAPEPEHLRQFHNHLVLQAGAYQNSTWVVATAKAGFEEGCQLIGGSCIVAPTGEIVALARTVGDELIVADCDLSLCTYGKETVFAFSKHRRIEHYGLIASQTGVVEPQ